MRPPTYIVTEPARQEQFPGLTTTPAPNRPSTWCSSGPMEEMSARNKRAIDHLVSGDDLSEALSLFGRAIAILEEVLDDAACEDAMADDDAQSIGSIDNMGYSSISTADHLAQDGIPNLNSGLLYLYDKPIQVAAVDDPAYCRAALLFNVSLTYHSLYQQTGHTVQLQNAVLLYDLSFHAFRNVSVNVSMNCCSTPPGSDFRIQIFMLAAWNNQGQIHLQMGNLQHTRDVDILQEQKALALGLLRKQGQRINQTELQPILNEFIINEYVVRTSITAPIALFLVVVSGQSGATTIGRLINK